MNDKLAAWFPLLLLTVLAALTFWLDRTVQPQASTGNGSARHDPDFIVDNLSSMRTSADGNITDTLIADKMTHYPDDDSTHLQMPKLVSMVPGKPPVTITSREALVSTDGENIFFKDDVRVTRSAYADRSEMVMETSYLHVIPQNGYCQNRPAGDDY